MSMILTNNGKAILYLNNWGNGKNNIGNDSQPSIKTNGGNSNVTTYTRGAIPPPKLIPIHINDFPYSQIPYSLYLTFYEQEKEVNAGTTYFDIRDYNISENMQLINSNIYNKNIEEISYNNPFIIGLTNTYQFTGAGSTTIKTIGLCAPVQRSTGSDNSIPTLIAVDGHLNIPISSGDRITFTIIIR